MIQIGNKKGSLRVNDDDKKKHITLKITSKVIDELRTIENYNPKLEDLIIEFIKVEKNKD